MHTLIFAYCQAFCVSEHCLMFLALFSYIIICTLIAKNSRQNNFVCNDGFYSPQRAQQPSSGRTRRLQLETL